MEDRIPKVLTMFLALGGLGLIGYALYSALKRGTTATATSFQPWTSQPTQPTQPTQPSGTSFWDSIISAIVSFFSKPGGTTQQPSGQLTLPGQSFAPPPPYFWFPSIPSQQTLPGQSFAPPPPYFWFTPPPSQLTLPGQGFTNP
jgi:hypothetical protein